MPFLYDIVVETSDRSRVLVVECKRMKVSADVDAATLRRNLASHGVDLGAAFFMLALPANLFLWSPRSAMDALPAFRAAAKPVLKSYLGPLADQPSGPLPESLEIAVSTWLSDLAAGIREPDPASEPERMIVESGLLAAIKGGIVRTHVST